MNDDIDADYGCAGSVVTWQFYVDDPDGERRLRECLDAPNVKSALWDFDQELRRRWKYGEEGDQLMTVEQVRGLLCKTLAENGINLWED